MHPWGKDLSLRRTSWAWLPARTSFRNAEPPRAPRSRLRLHLTIAGRVHSVKNDHHSVIPAGSSECRSRRASSHRLKILYVAVSTQRVLHGCFSAALCGFMSVIACTSTTRLAGQQAFVRGVLYVQTIPVRKLAIRKRNLFPSRKFLSRKFPSREFPSRELTSPRAAKREVKLIKARSTSN